MLTVNDVEHTRQIMQEDRYAINPDLMLIPHDMEPVLYASVGLIAFEDALYNQGVPKWATQLVSEWWWAHRRDELAKRGELELNSI